MSRHQEAPQFHNYLDSLMQGSEARRKMIQECLHGNPSITDLKRVISHPRTSRLAQLAGVLLIASYTTAVGGLPFLDSHTTQAETLKTSTPKPITEVGSMPSQVALQETATPQEAIILTSSSIPYEWEDTEGNDISWIRNNAVWGEYPNSPRNPTGTIEVEVNDIDSPSFQTKNSLYKEITNGTATSTAVIGTLVDKDTYVGFMLSAVLVNNRLLLRLERIKDARNPRDYSDGTRLLMEEGVLASTPQSTEYEDIADFYESQDSQGKYLVIVTKHAEDPSKNGTDIQRLDSQCNFVGIPQRVNKAHRIYIPGVMRNVPSK